GVPQHRVVRMSAPGSVAERPIALDLKSSEGNTSGSSNLPASAAVTRGKRSVSGYPWVVGCAGWSQFPSPRGLDGSHGVWLRNAVNQRCPAQSSTALENTTRGNR